MALLPPPECQDNSFVCLAGRALPWLYWIAGLLGFLLLVVIVLAIRYWRRTKDSNDSL